MEEAEKIEEKKEEKIEAKLLDLKRVAHTRAGGKKLRFRAVMVVGNKAGKVGVGVASGLDVAQAIEKATFQAKKNMIEVPIVNDTIPHEVYAKYGPAKILLKPQKKGKRIGCRRDGKNNLHFSRNQKHFFKKFGKDLKQNECGKGNN